jgi:hypothetical protein
MSGMRRVDGNFKSKSKYAQKIEEEEINFQEEDLYEESEKTKDFDSEKKTKLQENYLEDKVIPNENTHFEKLKIEEIIYNNNLTNPEENKNQEIKINHSDIARHIKELEDATCSSRDDSQVSINEGKYIYVLFFLIEIFEEILLLILFKIS